MNLAVVAVITGLALGSTYSMIALGIVLIYRTTGVFNLAYGQLMLLAAFIVGDLQTRGSGSFVGQLLLSVIVTSTVAVLCYLLVLRWTVGSQPWVGFVATLVLASIMDAGLAIKYGSSAYAVTIPWIPTGAIRILGVQVASASLVVAIVGLVVTAAVIAVLRWTRLGIQVRAAGQAPLLASQGGIQVRRLYVGSWAAAGVLAALAGVLYGSTSTVDSSLPAIALVAIPGVVLGGLDSLEGALVGGVAIGVLQGFTAMYLGGEYVNVVTWTLLLVLLLIRPQGLFGTANVIKI